MQRFVFKDLYLKNNSSYGRFMSFLGRFMQKTVLLRESVVRYL